MFNVEGLSVKIATYIACSLQMNNEKKAVMAYGIFGFLQVLLSILVVILFGLLFDVLAESLIIAFTVTILRKYSGGAHAGSPGKCILIGTVITIIPAIIIHYLSFEPQILLIVGTLIFIWSFYLVFVKAPVDSTNKPIKNPQKIKRLKSGSLIILGIYLLISVFFLYRFYFSGGSDALIKYAASVIYGTVWQTFTLTGPSSKIIKFFDRF